MSAQDLGKKLLAEVEEMGLDEILNSVRVQRNSFVNHFGVPPLDSLLIRLAQARPYIDKQSPPVLELTSLHPAGGKTQLLYHLTALAVLPNHAGGKQACVVILDTDGRFSVPRLVQQLQLVAFQHAEGTIQERHDLDAVVLEESLRHVHLYQPQSLPSVIATIDSLPDYLFDPHRHHSSQRPLHFIAIDSVSAFHWQARAENEDSLAPLTHDFKPAYAQLASALISASKMFWAPIVWTSWHLSLVKKNVHPGPPVRSFRPATTLPMQTLVDLRLLVRQAAVRNFPAEITVEEARREADIRQRVVDEGIFECFVNEWGMDERVLEVVEREGLGFHFKITKEGVSFPEDAAEMEV